MIAATGGTALRAEDGTQTRDPQLGRLMLYQLSYFRRSKKRINARTRAPPSPCRVRRGGFEPPKAKPADLQSAPVGHFGICASSVTSAMPASARISLECGCKCTTKIQIRQVLLPLYRKKNRIRRYIQGIAGSSGRDREQASYPAEIG